MPVRVNYLTVKDSETITIGQIEFFDYFIETSKDFPYLNLNQKNVTLQYQNWPELVPYLYEKTLDVIDNNASVNTFAIATMSVSGTTATLNFTNTDAIKIITALNQDREAYFTDNGGVYGGWNKTFTPVNDIAYSGTTYFASGNNFYITGITISSNSVSITATASQSGTLTNVSLTNIYIEFGVHRIPGQIKSGATFTGSVFFSGLNGKYFCNDNKNDLLNGLNLRSQITGHSHRHTHSLNNHTHIFTHKHGMNNHTHNMAHSHGYTDSQSTAGSVYDGTAGAYRATNVAPLPTDIYKETAYTDKTISDSPNINITGPASVTVTDSIDKNLTSNIVYTQVMTSDDGLNSTSDNLRVNSALAPETYVIYAYMYGRKYIT